MRSWRQRARRAAPSRPWSPWSLAWSGSRWLGRCASACGVGQLVAQVHAGADAELREHLVQVPLDRARAEEELCADLLICLPVPGEPRDLLLLRSEQAACL